MPKSQRLSRKEPFQSKNSRRVAGELFSAFVARAPSTKVACVVPKKTAARASVRNLIKRRVRALLAKEIKTLPFPISIVLHARAAAGASSFEEISADIRTIIKKTAVALAHDSRYNAAS